MYSYYTEEKVQLIFHIRVNTLFFFFILESSLVNDYYIEYCQTLNMEFFILTQTTARPSPKRV